MQTMLSSLLPLAEDPFPPTHKAGSDFEGFFFRLQSHCGRTQEQHKAASASNGNTEVSIIKDLKRNKDRDAGVSSSINASASASASTSSPSRIPRLVGRNTNINSGSKSHDDNLTRVHKNRDDSSSSSTPPSPSPSPSRSASSASKLDSLMLTSAQHPVFDSPDSFIPPSSSSPSSLLFHPNFNPATSATSESKAQHQRHPLPLPSNSPGDLILVICQLQTAPIDQRICIYLRWIVHGEEEAQSKKSDSYQVDSYSAATSVSTRRGSKRPPNAVTRSDDSEKSSKGESFEIITYIPSWKVKLLDASPHSNRYAGTSSTTTSQKKEIQPFRIDLPDPLNYGQSLGFMQVSANGNVVVDVTVPRANNSSAGQSAAASASDGGGGTRVRIRTNQHVPWSSSSSSSKGKNKSRSFWEGLQSKFWPIGSNGPEGMLQHLGPLLPLHWYVHTSGTPATFSLENVSLPYFTTDNTTTTTTTTRASDGRNGNGVPPPLLLPIAAGRATLHVEKNWGHGFPTGWVWGQASTPLPDPSQIVPESPKSQPQAQPEGVQVEEPEIKLMFAGGSILALTAFLVGIRIHYPRDPASALLFSPKASSKTENDLEWDFRPPFSCVGPGFSFSHSNSTLNPSSTHTHTGQPVHTHYGLGMKLVRDFTSKTIELQVWDLHRWAIIKIHADPTTFGTKIPGPTKEFGWSPDYCHHSYRAKAEIRLFERRWWDVPKTYFNCVRHPRRTIGHIKTLLSPTKYINDGPSGNATHLDAWKHTLGWSQIAHHHIHDRVALEFGGNFAA